MSENLNYYKERKFDSSEELKKFDPFEREIPITYTKGCSRHIATPVGRCMLNEQPGFGTVITDEKYLPLVNEGCDFYRKLLAVNTLINIYGESAIPNDVDEITPEIANEVLMRFYPSTPSWIDGEKNEDQKPMLQDLLLMYSENPEDREKFFD